MKKRIILIGRSMAGKTTLIQYLTNSELKYRKTQTIEIINQNMIDTPGEYLERTAYRGALVVSAADADCIVLVQDAGEHGTMFPPGYASTFAKPCIGVVTKSDRASEKEIEDAWNEAVKYNENLSGSPAHDPFIEGSGMVMQDNYMEVLALDDVNEDDKTDGRIDAWVEQIKDAL